MCDDFEYIHHFQLNPEKKRNFTEVLVPTNNLSACTLVIITLRAIFQLKCRDREFDSREFDYTTHLVPTCRVPTICLSSKTILALSFV